MASASGSRKERTGYNPFYKSKNKTIKISRQLTENIIPQQIEEHIVNVYDFIKKIVAICLYDGQRLVVNHCMVFNSDLHDRNTHQLLYFVAERSKTIKYLYLMHDKMYKKSELFNMYKFKSSLPQSWNHNVHQIIITKDILHQMMTNFNCKYPWHKLPVFHTLINNKKPSEYNQQRLTFSISKMKFIDILQRNQENRNQLIPIIMFTNKGYRLEYIDIVRIRDGVDIAISYIYNAPKKYMQATGIHLNKNNLLQQHQLCGSLHYDRHCLDTFQSTIDDFHIGNPDDDKNRIKDLMKKNHDKQSMLQRLQKENEEIKRLCSELQYEVHHFRQFKPMQHMPSSGFMPPNFMNQPPAFRDPPHRPSVVIHSLKNNEIKNEKNEGREELKKELSSAQQASSQAMTASSSTQQASCLAPIKSSATKPICQTTSNPNDRAKTKETPSESFECSAFERVSAPLHDYEMFGDDLVKACTSIHPSLLDDWIHIITEHMDPNRHILSCIARKPHDVITCPIANRYYFNKMVNNVNEDTDYIFYRNLLDSIHCYVYHLEDVGLRVFTKHVSPHAQQINEEKEFEEKATELQVEHIFNTQREKTRILQENGLNFGMETSASKINKYNLTKHMQTTETFQDTSMDKLYKLVSKQVTNDKSQSFFNEILEEEYDSESVQQDAEDYLHSNLVHVLDSNICFDAIKQRLYIAKLHPYTFSIGYRFHYVPHIEDIISIGLNDLQSHPIRAKYESLKDEILNNNTTNLTNDSWQLAFVNANKYMATSRAKHMRCIEDEYGFNKGDTITHNHLLSIILYCYYTNLQKEFTATFRKNTVYESIKSLVKRHTEFAIWGKLLRETVEIFGIDGGSAVESQHGETTFPGRGPFYCGMDKKVVIPEFDISLFGPTSSSKCIEVATHFGDDDGILIQLNNDGENNNIRLKSFSCSWISCHKGEEEWLFCGGKYKIKIENITMMNNPQNFAPFFNALFYFDCMLNGSIMDFADCNIKSIQFKDKTRSILSNLINHRLSDKGFKNKYSKYINSTFKAYCLYKRNLIINIHQITNHFEFLSDLILHSTQQTNKNYDSESEEKQSEDVYKNIITSTVLKLFPNIEEIMIESTSLNIDYRTISEYRFNYFSLLNILSRFKHLFTVNDLKITIKAVHKSCESSNKTSWKLIKSAFWKQSLRIKQTNKEISTGGALAVMLNENCVFISRLY